MLSSLGTPVWLLLAILVVNVGSLLASPIAYREDDGLIDVGGQRYKRQASITARRWSQKTVYYYHVNTTAAQKTLCSRVFNYLQQRTVVSFVQNATATNRIALIYVEEDYQCISSDIGMKLGEQYIAIGRGCKYDGMFAQSVMIALGFYWSEVRSDRNTYINITLSSVYQPYRSKLVKANTTYTTNYMAFNFGSCLLSSYDQYMYQNSTTYPICSKPFDYFLTMGSGIITSYDIQLINSFYVGSENCKGITLPKCQNQGSVNYRKCTSCVCPLGYAGGVCQSRDIRNNGAAATATSVWKTVNWRIVGVSTICQPTAYSYRTLWVWRPAGYKYLQFRVKEVKTDLPDECHPGCRPFGCEIRLNNNKKLAGPRYCCQSAFYNALYTSVVNPTPIVIYTSTISVTFTIFYRAVNSNTTKGIDFYPWRFPNLDDCDNSTTIVIPTQTTALTTSGIETSGTTDTPGTETTMTETIGTTGSTSILTSTVVTSTIASSTSPVTTPVETSATSGTSASTMSETTGTTPIVTTGTSGSTASETTGTTPIVTTGTSGSTEFITSATSGSTEAVTSGTSGSTEVATSGTIGLTETIGTGETITIPEVSLATETLGTGATVTIPEVSLATETLGTGATETIGTGATVTIPEVSLATETLGTGATETIGTGETITIPEVSLATETLGTGATETLGTGETITIPEVSLATETIGTGETITIPEVSLTTETLETLSTTMPGSESTILLETLSTSMSFITESTAGTSTFASSPASSTEQSTIQSSTGAESSSIASSTAQSSSAGTSTQATSTEALTSSAGTSTPATSTEALTTTAEASTQATSTETQTTTAEASTQATSTVAQTTTAETSTQATSTEALTSSAAQSTTVGSSTTGNPTSTTNQQTSTAA